MTYRRWPRLAALLGSLMVAGIAPVASAQTPTNVPVVGVGVSALYDNEDDLAMGFAVDFAQAVKSGETATLGIVLDFSFHRFTGADDPINISSYMAGPRLTIILHPKYQPFVQFVIGGERCCNALELGWQAGAGIDIVLNDVFNFRAQYDLRAVRTPAATFDSSRLMLGLSMPLGGR